MSYSLNSLKGDYTGDYNYRGHEGILGVLTIAQITGYHGLILFYFSAKKFPSLGLRVRACKAGILASTTCNLPPTI